MLINSIDPSGDSSPLAKGARSLLSRYSWEIMLLIILALTNALNFSISPYYKWGKLLDATNLFLDKGFLAMSMTLVILTGYIDISVASTVALSSVVMAVSYNAGAGVPMPLAMIICLLTGAACGALNGLILVKFSELAPMIVTLATQIIYRGIALIILEDKAAGKFPSWYPNLGWGYAGAFPIMMAAFFILFLVFAFLLHKTNYGRTVYAVGKNKLACRFSGINVDRIIFTNFTLNGLMAAVTALFLTSRMGSTRPNVANAYEMDVIAMVVLGGVSTAGGKGRMGGVLISIFIVGLLRYGLGLININTQVLMMVVGGLLVLAVAIPEMRLGSLVKGRRPTVPASAKT
ncbi:MAG: ABC transporter permease [Oscillospiraceae bacterium]|jgi:rhamnose transport system permease protein|nr:ABC transporter permease [Oscillospiraceae bacterium]